MITVTARGDFSKTERFLAAIKAGKLYDSLSQYGRMGVQALASRTPVESGQTAASWSYEVKVSPGKVSIVWTNSNTVAGTPLVILLQYGHGTGTGGYVAGRDFINPAIQPIFDEIADAVWKRVTSL